VLRRSVTLPRPWFEPIGLELASSPSGHHTDGQPPSGCTATWLIDVPADTAYRPVRPPAKVTAGSDTDTFRWVSLADVLDSLLVNPDSYVAGQRLRELSRTAEPFDVPPE
jgi:hypothetical protein